MTKFGSYPELNFGIEEEFFIVNKEFNVVPKVNDIISKVPRCLFTNKIIYHELHKSQIEINSGVCEDNDDAYSDLGYLRGIISDAAKCNGLGLVGMGTHPTANWKHGIINPQYIRNLSRRKQLNAYLSCGTHVHFSMAKETTAVKTINALKYFTPLVIALSANSSIENCQINGFIDNRLIAVEKAHTLNKKIYAGTPPTLRSIEDWENYKGSADIPMYWDIRPNTKLGTMEIRICDAQPSIKNTVALASVLKILTGEIICKKMGIPYMEEKSLNDSRTAAIKHGFLAKYQDAAVGQYLKDKILPLIRDSMTKYGISSKEIKPVVDIINSQKNLAAEQVKIYNKTKNFSSATKNFENRFLK